MRTEIDLLVHVVCRDGVRADGKKIEKIMDIKKPVDQSELRSFLGMESYCLRFIKGFADISASLDTGIVEEEAVLVDQGDGRGVPET